MISVMTKDAFVGMSEKATAEEMALFHIARQGEDIDQDTLLILELYMLAYASHIIKRIASQLYGEDTQDEDVLPFN